MEAGIVVVHAISLIISFNKLLLPTCCFEQKVIVIATKWSTSLALNANCYASNMTGCVLKLNF